MSDAFRPITTSAKLSLPLNGTIYTTTREVPAEKELPDIGGTMEAELGAAWADSIIIEATETPGAGPASLKTQRIVHARIPTEAEQLESNWEWSTPNIGGTRFHGITRTVIYPSKDFDRATPAPASAMPISAGTTGSDYDFTGQGYMLVSRSAARSGMQLEPYFKVEVREYVKRSVMTNVGIDGLNGLPLFEHTTIYHASETVPGTGTPAITAAALFAAPTNAWWGIQDTGYENTASMLSSEWYAMTSSQVVAGTYHTGPPAYVEVRTHTSNQRYFWPPVLQYIEFMDWEKRDGQVEIYPRVVFKREGYDGPCLATYTLTWTKGGFSIPVAGQMLPNSIHYASPFFTINVSECLHEAIILQCDIGNGDPEFTQNVGSARLIEATSPTDWPSSIIAEDGQDPYRGGYLRSRVSIAKPGGSGGGSVIITYDPPTAFAVDGTPTDDTVVFEWTANPLATDHILAVATDINFTNHVAYLYAGTDSTETITGLTPETTYYARLTTVVGFHLSVPCAAISFETAAATP